MDWSATRNAIRTAVASATGLSVGSGASSGSVYWQNTAREGGWQTKVRAELRLKTWTAVGVDEQRRTEDDTIALCGNRRLVVSVRIVSESQANGAEAVGHHSSLLRTRIRRQSVLAALRESHVALSTVFPTVYADYESDERMVSAAITDIVFLSREWDVDTTEGTADWIETAQIESEHLVTEDGDNRDVVIDVDPDA